MWSNFLLFWLFIGCFFFFWCWFFNVSLPFPPLSLLFCKDSLVWFSAFVTSCFVWCFFASYISFFFSSFSFFSLPPSLPPFSFILFLPISLNLFVFVYIFLLITSLSLIFCLTYNKKESLAFFFFVLSIFLAGFIFFTCSSIIVFFLSYEMFLVPSFCILYKFAKTRRAIEAAYLMFFWTQFGAMFLLFSFFFIFFSTDSFSWCSVRHYNFSPFEVSFLTFCWVVGFGVKLPLWPFYGWLPKAHVEASTNFSIFLSGVLVKFAFYGLLRCLMTLNLDVSIPFIIPFIAVGISESAFKLFLQIDLKKIVAYATVIEMHWLSICIFSGTSPLIMAGFAMLVNHALLSSTAFLLVDSVNRRFKTRLITELSGLNLICPKLFVVCFVNCLLFLGFPGSLTFVSEILFFSYLIDLFPALAILLILFLYLFAPSFFFRSWFNIMFGMSLFFYSKHPLDLSSREFVSIFSLECLIYYLGWSWQVLLF